MKTNMKTALTAAMCRQVQLLEALTEKMPGDANREAIEKLGDKKLSKQLLAAYNTGYYVGTNAIEKLIDERLKAVGLKKAQRRALLAGERRDHVVTDFIGTFSAIAHAHNIERTEYMKSAIAFYEKRLEAFA